MNFPKLVIATDGHCSGVLLDGVFIGAGIEQLDFSTQNKSGEMKSTIRIMDLDVESSKIVPDGSQHFADFIAKLADKH